ncbi:MAG: hypothetical protein C3F11_14340 [Methylocystaceae bacterium]|nr:MAG: hypothetical protein C3F11_14340 [Methylocystaceae bacterium]
MSKSSALQERTGTSSEGSGPRLLYAATAWAALVACVAIFRPYTGIVGDSVLYMGHALARLDPDGAGQDLMWSLDGQMRFSAFPFLSESLAAALGVAKAAMVLSAIGLVLWSGALVALSRALVGRRRAIAVVLACASFPAAYNSHATVYFGEPIATPRVFAEAAILSALAALIAGRAVLAVVLSAVAALLHPIMALAGFATIYVHFCLGDRRWLWGGAVAAALCVGAAAFGVPVLDRLISPIDHEWLAMLRGPDDYLFPTTWTQSAWSLKVVQASTVALAAFVTEGAVRRFFAAVLVASLVAMAITLVLGDLFPLLLIVQMQPWRATWLLALAAAAAFAICATTLWREGPQSRFALALLGVAWLIDASGVGALLAIFAAAMRIGRIGALDVIDAKAVAWAWNGVAALIVLTIALNYGQAVSFGAAEPRGARPPPIWLMLDLHAFAVPVALLGAGLALAPPTRLAPRAIALANVALCALAWSLWRQEWDPYRAAIAKAGRQSELVRLLDARPGPVLWLGGNQEAWYWAGRPNWVAGMQGMAIVFSRELTFEWFERMRVLIDLGWIADGGTISRVLSKPDPVFPDLSSEKVRRFCARPDAPAWIIAPVRSADAAAHANLWRAPAARFAADPSGGPMVGVETYAVLPCAPARSEPEGSRSERTSRPRARPVIARSASDEAIQES